MDLPNSINLLNYQHLDAIKKNISLSNQQLYELSQQNQKFVATVQKLNNQAKLKITDDHPKHALVYLNEAQKILQYVASCGKNIDRNLIVCVLHNQACCYQRLWELQTCSNYLQALIYNILSHLRSQESSQQMAYSAKKNEKKEVNESFLTSLAGKSVRNRIQLCRYYLQYCAINSQLKKHEKAFTEGQKAILIIKALFKQLQYVSQNNKKDLYSPITVLTVDSQQYELKKKIVSGISSIDDEPNINGISDYLKTAKYFFNKWNLNKQNEKHQTMKQQLKTFSIGSIMQVKPISFEQNKQSTVDNSNIQAFMLQEKYHGNPLRIQSYRDIVHMVLLLAIGYFTIATELRLIANEKDKKSSKSKTQSNSKNKEYLESQVYHLITLIITSIYIPFDMLFMRHILTSYNNHYNHDIVFDNAGEGTVMKSFDTYNLAEKQRERQRDFDRQKFKLTRKLKDSNRLLTDEDNTTQVKRSHSKLYSSGKKSSQPQKDKKYLKFVRQMKNRNFSQNRTKSESTRKNKKKSVSPSREKQKRGRQSIYNHYQQKRLKTEHTKFKSKDSAKYSKGSHKSKESKNQYFKIIKNIKVKKNKCKVKKSELPQDRSKERVLNSPKFKQKKSKGKLQGTKSSLQIAKGTRTPLKHNISKYYF